MLKFIIVRPGSTEFDEQGRITGSLSIPLSKNGTAQAEQTAIQLTDQEIDAIYSAPCESAQQTAEQLAEYCNIKFKTLDKLQNLDRGLWNGKLIEELKQTQPKVYRQWQDHPETVCPPGGETLDDAQLRVNKIITKIIKKNREGVVAVVLPEPLASILCSILTSKEMGDLWKAECDCGTWEAIDVQATFPVQT